MNRLSQIALTVFLLISAQMGAAIPPPPPPTGGVLSDKAYEGIQMFCAGCHIELEDRATILGARERIAFRMGWILNPDQTPPSNAMPSNPSMQQFMLADENAEILEALREFITVL